MFCYWPLWVWYWCCWLLKVFSYASCDISNVLLGGFSALTLLVGWQEGHPACKKTEWWSAGMVICLEQGADLHMAQLMPLPLTVCCFSKIQIGFTFLVPAHPGIPGQRAVRRVCVCVCLTGCVALWIISSYRQGLKVCGLVLHNWSCLHYCSPLVNVIVHVLCSGVLLLLHISQTHCQRRIQHHTEVRTVLSWRLSRIINRLILPSAFWWLAVMLRS